jgi:hypothetical protein
LEDWEIKTTRRDSRRKMNTGHSFFELRQILRSLRS